MLPSVVFPSYVTLKVPPTGGVAVPVVRSRVTSTVILAPPLLREKTALALVDDVLSEVFK